MKQKFLHFIILCSAFLFAITAQAQTFTSLAIGESTGPTVPSYLVEFNGEVYFQGTDLTHGSELWMSNGTVSGTKLVSDIWPGSSSSSPAYLTVYNSKLYFQATDSLHGSELWVSDGTAAGTTLLKDIYPGTTGSAPMNFTVCNGKLYFTANDGTHGNELWVTDGTSAGTVIVYDINPGSNGSNAYGPFIAYNNKLYFVATNGTDGYKLWATNDTVTAMADSTAANPNPLLVFNNELFFSASSGLWETNGTSGGTQQVSTTSAQYPVIYNGKLYFLGVAGQLWSSDGTSGGTALVVNIGSGGPEYLTVCNNKIFFSGSNGPDSYQLWVSDGTQSGTTMLTDTFPSQGFNPTMFTVIGNTLYFSAEDSVNGYELYSSDGTGAGTAMHMPYAGTDATPLLNTSQLFAFNNSLYFGATYNVISLGLWKYTPVAAGITPTNPLANLAVYPNPFNQSFMISGLQEGELYHITISDVTGRIIEQSALSAPAGALPVNLAVQPAGMYLIRVQNGTQSQTLKLVKD